MNHGVWGLGFRVSGLGFRVWGLGFRVWESPIIGVPGVVGPLTYQCCQVMLTLPKHMRGLCFPKCKDAKKDSTNIIIYFQRYYKEPPTTKKEALHPQSFV